MSRSASTYFRFFRTAFVSIIMCVLFLGILMTTFCSKLYKDEKFREIQAVSDLFIGGIKDDFELTNSMYTGDTLDFHRGFFDNYGISMYVYDSDGNCVLSPNDENKSPISNSLKKKLDDDYYLDYDANEVSNKEPSILYGNRFFVKYGDNAPKRFYLAAYSSADDINSFNIKIIICYVLISSVCIFVAYVILRKIERKYTNNSLEFLRISKQYSKGDFSEKLKVTVPGNIQEISNYVNAMASNMENSDETSKTFIANVSHELRTPITTVSGFVDGILDGTIPKSRQQEYLILVSKEIKRLRILISSMLNMTRYESGTLKPNFKETNISDLVIQTVLMFEKKIDDKKLEIEGLDSETVSAVIDADLIQQVIYNLVENAVKFVNPEGTISFSFEKASDTVTIGIRNTGEGLKNNEIQQVFDRFYKTDSSRGKDATGLGLGLSISRKIVHLHNGRIIVKSVYGEYTEFAIQLPLQQNE